MNLIYCAIDARACEAISEIAFMAGNDERGFDMREEAISIAIAVARETTTLPLMFENSELLREAWEETQHILAMEAEQVSQSVGSEKAEQTRQAKVLEQIKAADWASLSLPTPESALTALLAGERLTANCHTAHYDADDGITWLTNAYGIDGVLCQEPDLQAVTSFLTDMAKGIEYGPVPY